MRHTHQAVLADLLKHPKMTEVPPELVSEAYGIMTTFAPTIAEVASIAGHWVRQVFHRGHVDIDNVRALAEAENAAWQASSGSADKSLAQDAFFAGVVWGQAHAPTGMGEMIHEGFDAWWDAE